MKKNYDFSNADLGKFYKENSQINLPIYLESKIQNYLHGASQFKRHYCFSARQWTFKAEYWFDRNGKINSVPLSNSDKYARYYAGVINGWTDRFFWFSVAGISTRQCRSQGQYSLWHLAVSAGCKVMWWNEWKPIKGSAKNVKIKRLKFMDWVVDR